MDVRQVAAEAKAAGRKLAALEGGARSGLLAALAARLQDPKACSTLRAANDADLADAERAVQAGTLSVALKDRLRLGPGKLEGLCTGLLQLAGMPEVVGRIREQRLLDEGLVLAREQVPLGLLGVVFESRPDALVQIGALALKSGNAVLLKGGSEATRSNVALIDVIGPVLEAHGVPAAALSLLTTRGDVGAMLALDDLVELVIARGSAAFVQAIQATSRIAVMGHAAGLCHLYLDRAANPDMAARVALDSKCDYPAACNAIETLLWHRDAIGAARSALEALDRAGVRLRGCPETCAAFAMDPATADDWDTEYNDLELSVRSVDDLDAALLHIARHGSKHTEVIVTADAAAAGRFLHEVDAASVFHNASSRFADGFRYGLGAEVGISTQKLHARGPVGLEGLLTSRWVLRGQGQVAADYGPGKRSFLHRDL
jgi:glutamate-5-semialdehyde dehydrogenase